MAHSPFKELVKHLFKTKKQTDDAFAELGSIAQDIHHKYKPRLQFNRWRDSQEGQLWKIQQYQAQSRCCASCGNLVQLKGSHIDHIKPLCLYPHLALDQQNM